MSEDQYGVADEGLDQVQDQQFEESPASDESDQGYDDYSEDYQDNQSDGDAQDQGEDPNFVALREQNEMLRRQIELMQYSQGREEQQQSNVPEYDPDDLPTNRQVDEIVQQRMQALQQQQRQQTTNFQVQMARQKYSDYDQVIKYADEIVGSNAGLREAIFAADNPAEVAYNLGKSHPDYLKVSQKKARSDIAGKVKNNFNRPNTLSQAGGGKPSTQKDFGSMSQEEFEKEVHRIKMLGT